MWILSLKLKYALVCYVLFNTSIINNTYSTQESNSNEEPSEEDEPYSISDNPLSARPTEEELKISFEEVQRDMPAIHNAHQYFEKVLAVRPRVDCSNYVPKDLLHLVAFFDKSNKSNSSEKARAAIPNSTASTDPRTAIFNSTSLPSSSPLRIEEIEDNFDSLTDLSDMTETPLMDAETRRLLRSSVYAKMLRPAVHECLTNETKTHDHKHPPVFNPFAPLLLSVTFGANKLMDLSFDGTLVISVQFTLKWNDSNWRWFTSTRYAIAYARIRIKLEILNDSSIFVFTLLLS